MCLAAAVSLPLRRAEEVLGVTQQALVDRLKNATESFLTEANFMNSIEIQTLQAFTIYLVRCNFLALAYYVRLIRPRSLSVVQRSQGRM